MGNNVEEYDENTVDEMTVDHNNHFNSGRSPELLDDRTIDDFITNLNDWD